MSVEARLGLRRNQRPRNTHNATKGACFLRCFCRLFARRCRPEAQQGCLDNNMYGAERGFFSILFFSIYSLSGQGSPQEEKKDNNGDDDYMAQASNREAMVSATQHAVCAVKVSPSLFATLCRPINIPVTVKSWAYLLTNRAPASNGSGRAWSFVCVQYCTFM